MASVREIVLDTETTGLSPKYGDRVIEIGCVEMIDKRLTGRTYHQYLNPERDIPAAATKVHGITDERVAGEPIFAHVAEAFLDFVKDSTLVIHNAAFDTGFLNAELERVSMPNLRRMPVVDTVLMARKKFPGSPANLDALCRRYGVSLERRDKHGALLDANLLADVYIHLCGGPQATMFEAEKDDNVGYASRPSKKRAILINESDRRSFPPSQDEEKRHQEFIKKIKSPLWTT